MAVDRRDSILEAACRVVGRVGADALRVSDVAREAGVSTALVHYYWSTRAELLTRAFLYADERAAQLERDATAGIDGAAARVERLLSLYLEEGREIYENWILWREMENHALFDAEFRPVLRESYRAWMDGLVAVVRDGQRDGAIAPEVDARAAVRRLVALVSGLGSQQLIGVLDEPGAKRLLAAGVALELPALATAGIP